MMAEFCEQHYKEHLHEEIFSYYFRDYLVQYLGIQLRHISKKPASLNQPKIERDYTTYDIASILRKLRVTPDHPALSLMEDLNTYQELAYRSIRFNYEYFDTD